MHRSQNPRQPYAKNFGAFAHFHLISQAPMVCRSVSGLNYSNMAQAELPMNFGRAGEHLMSRSPPESSSIVKEFKQRTNCEILRFPL
jgi:hypothetical protein